MFTRLALLTAAVAIFAAACSSNGGGSTQNVQGATQSAAVTTGSAGGNDGYGAGGGGGAASATTAAGNGSFTLMAADAGGKMVLVAGSNQMTVYTFTKDSANSGKSACSGGCAGIWPPLTISSGAKATAGPNCHGTVGTITRDDGTVQVTYNGLPLYFYAKDSKPGDTLGSYPSWNLVTP